MKPAINKFRFFDTTLRDGEQTPGLSFNFDCKTQIVRAMIDVGITIVEIGFPPVSEQERNTIRGIVDLNLPIELVVLCRPVIQDVDYAYNCGIRSIRFVLPKSKIYLSQLNIDINKIDSQLSIIIKYAYDRGLKVRFTYEHASKTPIKELVRWFKFIKNNGVEIISFADTAGVMMPNNMYNCIKELKYETQAEIAVHCHNDLGLATANTIAAAQAGAVELECCVNGIGERAGNAAFEEVAVILERNLDAQLSINFNKLYSLCLLVAKLSGISLASNKPIIGQKVFQHESGMHANSIIQGEDIYEAFPPSLIGRTHEITLGKHSSLTSLEYVLAQKSITLSIKDKKDLLKQIKLAAENDLNIDSLIKSYFDIEGVC